MPGKWMCSGSMEPRGTISSTSTTQTLPHMMDSMAIILIFVPLFAPIVVAQGFDLVWFGIIVIVVTEIALVTPPVGMNVFVLKAVLPEVPVMRIFRDLVPCIAVDVVRLGLLVAFPAVTLWLGSTVG
jgi:TRAP-type C4-dicarboxylate transport system permease large subunit